MPDNIGEVGLFCIKNKTAKGFAQKAHWYKEQYQWGLRLKIAQNAEGERMGFIECTPAEFAWRPLQAVGYLFVYCIMWCIPSNFATRTQLLPCCTLVKERRKNWIKMT